MPIYEYRCNNCGKFEVLQKIIDSPLQKCPKCGASVKRLISNVGVIYKTAGYYTSDNRSQEWREKERAAKSASKSSSAGASPSERT